jgi:hypothetical protein
MSDRIKKKPVTSRQYEISQNHIEVNSVDSEITRTYTPGGSPDMPAFGVGPDNRPHINRANEVSKNDSTSTTDFHMGLKAIDEAIFYYFENVIKPSVISNGDMVDVPIIYGSGERWKLAQKDGFYRDKGGKIQTPLIMLKRDSISKRRDLGNKLDANNPQLYITYQERYTSRNQYDNFAILNNRIPQKEYTATVVPDYVKLTYSGIIWTDYISQLNKVIEAINYASDSYWGDPERFKFMAMIDQFSNINELTNEDNRIVRASFTLELQGYIIPENIQKKLKESNTRWFSKSQININNEITSIEEEDLSIRIRQLNALRPTTNGVGVSTVQPGTEINDEDWIIADSSITNYGNKDVIINNGSLSLDIGTTKSNDILLINKNGNKQLKVDNNGLLSLKIFDEFPTVVEGGIIFKDNDFYIGL